MRLVALAAEGSGVAGGRVARREATKAADATSLGLWAGGINKMWSSLTKPRDWDGCVGWRKAAAEGGTP